MQALAKAARRRGLPARLELASGRVLTVLLDLAKLLQNAPVGGLLL